MATRSKNKISVSVSPGQNAPVNHVVRLEDLLLQLQPDEDKAPTKGRRAAKSKAGLQTQDAETTAEPGSVQQLAIALGQRLREARAAAAPPARAGRRAK